MAYSTQGSTAVSVTNFGARGDGVFHSRNTIQNAIDSLQSKGLPGTVLFPKGVYLSSGQIFITGNNITLLGEPGARLQAFDENDFSKIVVSGFTGILTSGVTIQDLTIDGGRTGGNSAAVYNGVINLINTQNTTIKNCSINNYLGIGVYTTYNNEYANIENNYFSNYHLGVFNNGTQAGCGLKYLTVDNNIFDTSWGSALGSNYFTAIKIQGPHGYPCYGHKITNNAIRNPSLLGIELWGQVTDSIVANNYIESGVFGISIAAESKNITVEGNTTRNTITYGIEVAESEKVTVVGNIVDGGDAKSTRDGIIANSSQNVNIVGNTISNCNHANVTTYVSNGNLWTKNVAIVGNNLIQTGIGGVPFYYQNGHNINFSENVLDCRGSGNYFVMIDTANNTVQQTGLTIARNDFIGSVTDWGILFYLPTSSGIQNVLIEQNKTYSVNSCGYGMINAFDYPPTSALARNNYGRTGSLGYYISDFQIPAAGGTPYGNSNIFEGISYYGQVSWTIPNSGVTGSNEGVWLCVWSGGGGFDNALRLRAYNGAVSALSGNIGSHIWESYLQMAPYVGSFLTDSVMVLPGLTYNTDLFTEIHTQKHETQAQNSVWIKVRPLSSGFSGQQLTFAFSAANSLTSPFASYETPVWAGGTKGVLFAQYDAAYIKLSNGLAIGESTRIYSPSSGVLVFDANTISGLNSINYWTSGSNQILYNNTTGFVGIGTSTPRSRLHVAAENGSALSPQLTIGGVASIDKQLMLGYDISNNYGFLQAVEQNVAYRNLTLQEKGGNVGIVTTNPTASLHVSGTFRTDIATSTTANVGGATLPANPVGFVTINITGGNFKIPYYNI